MIVYVSSAQHQYTVRSLLESRSTALDGRFIVLSHDEFCAWRKLPVGHYIFTDADRLPAHRRTELVRRVAMLRTVLPKALRILNDPAHFLGRMELLEALQAAGINDYRARRCSENLADLRFPLFLRIENDHTGAQTPLLHSADDLQRALQTLREHQGDLQQCVAIEYVDVRNAEGLHEKYSIFRVGEAFYAAEYGAHGDWVVKGVIGELWTAEWGRRELEFQRQNPHLHLLRPVFELAGVEYGRVDYAFSAGRLQVFEINTNPMLDCAPTDEPLRKQAQTQFIEAYVSACLRLDAGMNMSGMVSVPGACGSDVIEGGSGMRNVVRRLLRCTRQLSHEVRVMRVLKRLSS